MGAGVARVHFLSLGQGPFSFGRRAQRGRKMQALHTANMVKGRSIDFCAGGCKPGFTECFF